MLKILSQAVFFRIPSRSSA
ncbi:hypothetical protein MXB_2070 [Myxobolus squamalis]|nr:hypothetical protein MXB_2070 [Myxobolus squamalis]